MNTKIWIVMRREFLSTIRRKGWLIATFGMPFFLLLYVGFASFMGLIVSKGTTRSGVVGIVDLAGFVRLPEGGRVQGTMPPEASEALDLVPKGSSAAAGFLEGIGRDTQFRSYPDEATARRALDSREIAYLMVVPADYLETGKILSYDSSNDLMTDDSEDEAALRRILIESLLEGRVDPAVRDRVLSPVKLESWTRQKDGTWQRSSLLTIILSLGIPLGFSMLLLISLMSNSGLLLQGVGEEKENRVIEVILSSISARGLLVGKLFGLGSAGLLQLAIWLTMAVGPAIWLLAGFAMSPGLVLVCLVYFVLGFLLFGTLMTGTGVIGTNSRESQQYGMFWAIGSVIPWMFFPMILNNPNGTPARVLSYIPLTAPIAMMMRAATGELAWWEGALSVLVLAASVWLALRLAARLFRTALLMYGKRPTIPEIWRCLRQA